MGAGAGAVAGANARDANPLIRRQLQLRRSPSFAGSRVRTFLGTTISPYRDVHKVPKLFLHGVGVSRYRSRGMGWGDARMGEEVCRRSEVVMNGKPRRSGRRVRMETQPRIGLRVVAEFHKSGAILRSWSILRGTSERPTYNGGTGRKNSVIPFGRHLDLNGTLPTANCLCTQADQGTNESASPSTPLVM